MIYSTGVDIVSIQRLMQSAHDDAFLDRLLTQEERRYIFTQRNPHKHLAGRFAAKEAVMKALGTGWGGGIGWRDIEIVKTSSGKPMVRLHSRARAMMHDKKILLSLSYTKDIAVAFAIVE